MLFFLGQNLFSMAGDCIIFDCALYVLIVKKVLVTTGCLPFSMSNMERLYYTI